jgi:oligogalacturonide lyase
MKQTIFLSVLIVFLCFCSAAPATETTTSNVGKRYPAEKQVITDQVTGYPITVLMSPRFAVSKPYQTDPTWTADGKWIIFTSSELSDKGSQLFVVNELTGDIVQLTDNRQNAKTGQRFLSRKEMKMFYIRSLPESQRQIVELNIGELINDSMSDSMKDPAGYERIVTSLPVDKPGSELSLDADETFLYWGCKLSRDETELPRPLSPRSRDRDEWVAYTKKLTEYFAVKGKGTGEISKINIQTGKIDKVLDVPFNLGHLQANPWVSGEIIFCKETGGDADQRVWSVRADGTNFRPIYEETPDEWVTHETVTSPDELMFIISGGDMFRREKPTGIAVVDLRTRQMRLLGQTYETIQNSGGNLGGFWHCQGSPDGRWAVADTHSGKIILLNRANGEQILMSTGHPMRPDHAHPVFSHDSKRILIQSALLNQGQKMSLMVMNVPER